MTPDALADYLHTHIQLSQAMAVSVVEASADQVTIEAPLGPNVNVHGTMFGGSAAVLGLLAAWSVLHLRLEAEGIANQLVIHRTEMEYLKPISGTARAVARLHGVDWSSFAHMLERRGKARLKVTADLWFEGEAAARLVGEFVAIVER
jgi:thioesterase domain-containing protein